MLPGLVAKQREWKDQIYHCCIYKNRSVPFHKDKFYSDWTEQKPSSYILVLKNEILHFLVWRIFCNTVLNYNFLNFS